MTFFRTLIPLSLLIGIASSLSHGGEPKRLPLEKVLATVAIQSNRERGSGVVIGKSNTAVLILTAKHLFINQKQHRFQFFSPDSYPDPSITSADFKLLAESKTADLALVEVRVKNIAPILSLQLAKKDVDWVGRNVHAIGSRSGRAPVALAVKIESAIRIRIPDGETMEAWQVSPAQLTGFSGGPLVDGNGTIIGIASGVSNGRGYYVQLSEIQRFFKRHEKLLTTYKVR